MKADRIESLAREIARRESGRGAAREEARRIGDRLREEVARATERFAAAAADEGAPHLDLLTVGPVEPDDKSIRAFQFRVRRGRFEAIVVSKDRGEVMFVGPFRRGGAEAPCVSVRFGQGRTSPADLDEGLETLLVGLVKESFEK